MSECMTGRFFVGLRLTGWLAGGRAGGRAVGLMLSACRHYLYAVRIYFHTYILLCSTT